MPGLWESSWRDLPGISGSGMRSRPSGMRWRSAEPEDIRRAGRTMAFAGGLLLAACAGIRAAVILGGIVMM